MSIFQTLFSCLLPGSPGVSPISTTKASPAFGLRGLMANQLTRTGSPLISTIAPSLVSPRTVRSTARDDRSGFVERYFGLGMIIAKAIGLRLKLGLVSRPLRLTLENSAHGSTHGSYTPRSPSPLTLDSLEDPWATDPAPGFARATPPKVHWCQPSSAPETPAPCTDIVDFQEKLASAEDPAAAETRYRASLEGVFELPPPAQDAFNMPTVVIPPHIDLDLAPHDTAPAWHPPADTRPAWSATSSKRTLAEDAPQGAEESKDEGSASSSDEGSDGDSVGSGSDGGYEDEPPTVLVHPDGTAYHLLGTLGKGAGGRVMLAATSRGELVALKVMSKSTISHFGLGLEPLHTERRLMLLATMCNMSFLMHLKASWDEGDNVYYVMDMCAEDLGTRMKRAARSGNPIPPREVKLLCAELLLGLQELAGLRIVHGDIKPENILVRPSGRIVITDFGLSQCAYMVDRDGDHNTPFEDWEAPEVTGTPRYHPPEVLRRYEKADADAAPFTSKVDVFSLGLVFGELMSGCGKALWETGLDDAVALGVDIAPVAWRRMDDTQRQAARMMTEGLRNLLDASKIPDTLARSLLSLMLEANPKDRPTPTELLRHPYFWDLDVEAVRAGHIPHEYEARCFSSLDLSVRDVSLGPRRNSLGRHEPPFSGVLRPLENFTWPDRTAPGMHSDR